MQAAVLDVVAGVAVAAAPDADVHIVRTGNLQEQPNLHYFFNKKIFYTFIPTATSLSLAGRMTING